MSTTTLRVPIRRKLQCNDGTRKRRPLFVEITPEGVISVWARRCTPFQTSIMRVYEVAITDTKERAKIAKARARGQPFLAKRGLLR